MIEDDLIYCEHHSCTWAKIHCVQRRRRAVEARACSTSILRQKFPVDDTIQFGYCAKCEQGKAIAREFDGPVADPRDTFRVPSGGYHVPHLTQLHQAKGKRPQNYVRPRLDLSAQIEAHGCETEADLLRTLYEQRGDCRRVAGIIGCSKTFVSKRLKAYGVPLTGRYKHGR